MRVIGKIAFFLSVGILASCGGDGESRSERIKNAQQIEVNEAATQPTAETVPASERITTDNKGVGKVKNIELSPTIDEAMVARGADLFKTNCTACHKTDKRFIGPNPTGILERRSPEWIMNMILDPKLMTEEDQCAKDLLVEFNGAAMANQNMTEAQARDILEYFRTLK